MRDRVYRFLIVILLGMAVFFGILAYREHKPFLEAKISHEAIKKTAVVPESDEDAFDPMNRRIDFALLKEVNPDIIGWLYIPQIGVDEPILHGKTDREYLSKGFDGKYSILGSVFTFAHANEKLSDPHTCLFGHNMMSGQIFGRLDELTVDENGAQSIYIYTPERTKGLTIVSVYSCHKKDAVFQDDWKMDQEDVQTFTLATCTGYSRTPYRLGVNCKVTKEKLIL